jgi:hypothetical protein
MRVSKQDFDNGAYIFRFEVDRYELKEQLNFIAGDDEEMTQFNVLIKERIEYWKSEGSA